MCCGGIVNGESFRRATESKLGTDRTPQTWPLIGGSDWEATGSAFSLVFFMAQQSLGV